MPCYERRYITQELKKALPANVEQAMKDAGATSVQHNQNRSTVVGCFADENGEGVDVRFEQRAGTLRASSLYSEDATVNKILSSIKKKHSEVLVKKIARRFGWTVQRNRQGDLEATRKRYAQQGRG